jgi:hypothetical protein
VTADHVRAGKSVPVTGCPDVTGLMPIDCAHCGAAFWLGLPLDISTLALVVGAFTTKHSKCTPHDQTDEADE